MPLAKAFFIIINWNGQEKIRRCLHSLKTHLHHLNYEILVVDNNSTDRSCEIIRQQFSEVILIANKQNVGYARACNQALEYLRERQISFDYVVFLNNDVEIRDSSLVELFLWMEQRKEVAACLPAILDPRGKPQSGVGGFELSLASAFFHFFFFAILFPQAFRGLFINQRFFYKKKGLKELDWLSGVALIVRHSTLDIAGPMPEFFFMYAEDLAYGQELRKAGNLIYFPWAKVYHRQERKGSFYQVRWLDSIFTYYWLRLHLRERSDRTNIESHGEAWSEQKVFLPLRFRLQLLLLKLIFLSGLSLRWVGYAFWSALSQNDEPILKKKEMAVYCLYITSSIMRSWKQEPFLKSPPRVGFKPNLEK